MSNVYKSILLSFPLMIASLYADDFPKPLPLSAHVPLEHESNEPHAVNTVMKKIEPAEVKKTESVQKEAQDVSFEEDDGMPQEGHDVLEHLTKTMAHAEQHHDVKDSIMSKDHELEKPQAPQHDEHGHVVSGVGFSHNETAEEKLLAESQFDTAQTKGSGNWVYKNYWWRKIEELYDQIKEVFNKIMSFRIVFFKERSDADKKLDNFYQKAGMDQGSIDSFLNTTLEIIDKEKKDQGYLTKKEREFLERIKEKQRQLEQLQADVKAIMSVDRKIDEALDVVAEQITICNTYEQHAWDIFKSIARELNDKEARKQYYEVEALLKDIENVDAYLRGPFRDYFEKLHAAIDEHTEKILTQIATLKRDGIDITKEAKAFEQEDISQELVKEEQQQSHDVDNGSPMAQESDSSLNVHHEGAGHADQSSHIEAQKKDTHKETEMPAKQQPKKIKTTFTQRMYGWLQSAGSTIGSLARAIIGDTAVDYFVDALILA